MTTALYPLPPARRRPWIAVAATIAFAGVIVVGWRQRGESHAFVPRAAEMVTIDATVTTTSLAAKPAPLPVPFVAPVSAPAKRASRPKRMRREPPPPVSVLPPTTIAPQPSVPSPPSRMDPDAPLPH